MQVTYIIASSGGVEDLTSSYLENIPQFIEYGKVTVLFFCVAGVMRMFLK